MFAVLDSASLIMGLFKCDTKQCARKIVQMVYCDNFKTEPIGDMLKSVTS